MEELRKISKKYYLRQVMACWLMCWMVFGTSIALATPSGGAFTVGTGVINDGVVGGDNTVLVNQAASVIEWGGSGWGGIDTSSSESLTFSQLAGLSNSAVLNNIKSGNVTQFNGTLNGVDMRIFIVNDAGIIFGNGATVNATQLVASSLNISNEDFTNGIYQFSGGGIGEVANYGQISAEQVALIGRKVLNAGVIRSPNGYVLMAAGDRVFLGTKGSGVVVEVSSVTVPDVPAVEGIGDVINEGTIEASGGKIVLAAGDTFSRAIEGLDGMSVAVEG